MNQPSSNPSSRPQHRRHVRNFLLDKHFQLKYTAYLAGVAALLSAALGALLWNTSREVIDQSRAAMRQGEQVVAQGQKVLAESRKVSAVVRMNLVAVPEYAENPELAAVFGKEADSQDQRLAQQHRRLEEQARALKARAVQLESQQRSLLVSIFGVLTLLVAGLAALGIIVTHKVAGPLFKMKRQIQLLGEGKLRMPLPLRKGDELGDFFRVLEVTVAKLRESRRAEVARLGQIIEQLPPGTEAVASALSELRQEKQASME